MEFPGIDRRVKRGVRDRVMIRRREKHVRIPLVVIRFFCVAEEEMSERE